MTTPDVTKCEHARQGHQMTLYNNTGTRIISPGEHKYWEAKDDGERISPPIPCRECGLLWQHGAECYDLLETQEHERIMDQRKLHSQLAAHPQDTAPNGEQLAWAAGFMENTGTFTNSRAGAPRYYAVTIREDRVATYQKFANIVGIPMTKTSIGYGIQANSDAVHALMELLGPWLSPERVTDYDYINVRQHLKLAAESEETP